MGTKQGLIVIQLQETTKNEELFDYSLKKQYSRSNNSVETYKSPE